MTYFKDLSAGHFNRPEPDIFVYVGWLSQTHPYEQGDTPPGFIERLTLFCENPPEEYALFGFHACEFCGRFLGSNEIRVIGVDKVYAAPVLIFHYVEAHNYRPPQEFIDAVLAAPLPDSEEMLQKYGPSIPHDFPEQVEDERSQWND